MPTVPCSAGVADDCVGEIPLGAVSARDPDAAVVCEPCDYELMGKKLTFENGELVDDEQLDERDEKPRIPVHLRDDDAEQDEEDTED